MTKIFVICLVLFPVMFAGALVATGTLQALVPQMKAAIEEALGRHDGEEPTAPGPELDAIDALVVAEIEGREAAVRAAMDSLSVIQSRIETERRELSALSREVQNVVEELRAMETSLDERRDRERKSIASIVGAMEPESAAVVLSMLDRKSTEFLVKAMKPRVAAEVLGLMPANVSAPLIQSVLNPTDGTTQGMTP